MLRIMGLLSVLLLDGTADAFVPHHYYSTIVVGNHPRQRPSTNSRPLFGVHQTRQGRFLRMVADETDSERSMTTENEDDDILAILQSQAGSSKKRRRKPKPSSTRQVLFAEPVAAKADVAEHDAVEATMTGDIVEAKAETRMEAVAAESLELETAPIKEAAVGPMPEPSIVPETVRTDLWVNDEYTPESMETMELVADEQPLAELTASEDDEWLSTPAVTAETEPVGEPEFVAAVEKEQQDGLAEPVVVDFDDKEPVETEPVALEQEIFAAVEELVVVDEPVDNQLVTEQELIDAVEEPQDAIADLFVEDELVMEQELFAAVEEQRDSMADLVADEPFMDQELFVEEQQDTVLPPVANLVVDEAPVETVPVAETTIVAAAAAAATERPPASKSSYAPGSASTGGYRIVADTGFLGGLSSGGKSIVIEPVRSYYSPPPARPTSASVLDMVESAQEILDAAVDVEPDVFEEAVVSETDESLLSSSELLSTEELEMPEVEESIFFESVDDISAELSFEDVDKASLLDLHLEEESPFVGAANDETDLVATDVQDKAELVESSPYLSAAQTQETSSSSMNLRPKQYWRAPNVTESVRPVEKVVEGLDIFSPHVIDDSFRSSTMLGETLEDQIQHMSAEADDYEMMKFVILQRRGAHERDIKSFEIVLAPGTSGDFGWTLYNMDEFVGHTEVDDGILGGSIFVGPNELAEVTVNYIDSTERIGTGTPITGEEETIIRCANRGAEWYINGELVAATPQFRRGICDNGIPAPYVGIQKGSFRFTKIELVDAPVKPEPAGLIGGDVAQELEAEMMEQVATVFEGEPEEISAESSADDVSDLIDDETLLFDDFSELEPPAEVEASLSESSFVAMDYSEELSLEPLLDIQPEAVTRDEPIASTESLDLMSEVDTVAAVDEQVQSIDDSFAGVDKQIESMGNLDAEAIIYDEDLLADSAGSVAVALEEDELSLFAEDSGDFADKSDLLSPPAIEPLSAFNSDAEKKSYAPTRKMKNVTTSGYLGDLTSPSSLTRSEEQLTIETEIATPEPVSDVLESLPPNMSAAVEEDSFVSIDSVVTEDVTIAAVELESVMAVGSIVTEDTTPADIESKLDIESEFASTVEVLAPEEEEAQTAVTSAVSLDSDLVSLTSTSDVIPKKTYAPGGGVMKNVTTSGYLGEIGATLPHLADASAEPVLPEKDVPPVVAAETETETTAIVEDDEIALMMDDDESIAAVESLEKSLASELSVKTSYAPTKNMKNVSTNGYLGDLSAIDSPSGGDSVLTNDEPVPVAADTGAKASPGVTLETAPAFLRGTDAMLAMESQMSSVADDVEIKMPEPVLVGAGVSGPVEELASLETVPKKSYAPGSKMKTNVATSGYLGELSSTLPAGVNVNELDVEPITMQEETSLPHEEHSAHADVADLSEIHVSLPSTEELTATKATVETEVHDMPESPVATSLDHSPVHAGSGTATVDYASTLREFSVGPKGPVDAETEMTTVGDLVEAEALDASLETTSPVATSQPEELPVVHAYESESIEAPAFVQPSIKAHDGYQKKVQLPFFFAAEESKLDHTDIVSEEADGVVEEMTQVTDDNQAIGPAITAEEREISIPSPEMDLHHMAGDVMHKLENQVAGPGIAFVSEAAKKVEGVWAKLKESKPFRPIPVPDVGEVDLVPDIDTKGMTERIMRRIPQENQANGAGGVSTWEGFLKAEENWSKLKESKPFRVRASNPPPQFVVTDGTLGNPKCWEKLRQQRDKSLDYDVVVCGGTLGIFFATALQLKGMKVAVLEAGKLRGREQEWNISMEELLELKRLGVLSQEDIDASIKTEFPGCRSGFKNLELTPLQDGYFDNGIGYECVTNDVLNLGISPAILIERVGRRFKELGGVLREETRLYGVTVSDNVGSALDLGSEMEPITSSLVLDCMGNASPITRQQRWGMKPDGICAVVGSCAGGYEKETNLIGDIIYTNTEIQDKGENGMLQYFWEAFPVGIGRDGKEPGTSDVKTTYMFTYMDADKKRPSLESLMEDYWRLLPKYQKSIKNPETDLDIKRVLFAYFPTYRDSPLKPQWNRVLAVGDASGIQSPLSFGGFAALTRHLDRISTAVVEAVQTDCLHKDELSEINAYTPNLSAAWMFQKAMSVRMGQKVDPKFINRLLAANFEIMDTMGDRTIKPFLQDIIKLDSLIGSLSRSFVADPTFMPEIVKHVGIPTLVEWMGHVGMMGVYTALDTVVAPVLKPVVKQMEDPKERFQWRRRMEAWKFGSGRDYVYSPNKQN